MLALAILVDKDLFDLEVAATIAHLHSSDKFRSLFLMVIEVPEADLICRCTHQLVILVIEMDQLGVCLELEQTLL